MHVISSHLGVNSHLTFEGFSTGTSFFFYPSSCTRKINVRVKPCPFLAHWTLVNLFFGSYCFPNKHGCWIFFRNHSHPPLLSSEVKWYTPFFGFALLSYAIGVKKTRTTLSSNQTKNPRQSSLACTHFPALRLYLLRVLIGLLDCLCPLWLARVVIEWHSSLEYANEGDLESKGTGLN